MKRFDSADYFMSQHQRRVSLSASSTRAEQSEVPSECSRHALDLEVPPNTARNVLLLPPPLQTSRANGELAG